ncbi:hypothetical protein HER10_EVM0004110 [Colletotrichum scovillei]|uniref:uncharacterized protein n=1 Tax=Colletotrichum scovillei TaxID=1209932 RepID=UPI0015C404B2|nr:uncharacterized protein HER10_EVM0004110 [Colletotrichum scovillei]KAF4776175.1 hypothetical protein HER10_EVM0004110 [Colletotrichum scovillei]
MALRSALAAALALSPFIGTVAAHGSHTTDEIATEIALRDVVTVHGKRALDACSNSPAALALKQRALERRANTAQMLREKRGLTDQKMHQKRAQADLVKWAAVDHESTEAYNLDTPLEEIFGSNATCALVPLTTIGPYYVEGELIRVDTTDGQAGVPVHLDIQFVETLAPYTSNTQTLTTNLQDGIAAGEATALYDPFLKYVRLGEDLNDGLLMWITIGIDTTADYSDEVRAAAHYYEGGGVDQSSGGDGPGGPPPNGTFPTGAPPGAPPTSTPSA